MWLSQDSMLDSLALEKSLCCKRLSFLSCLPLICSPQPLPHTHTAFLHPSHNSVLQQLSPMATSVPCPLRDDDMCLMANITALSTFSVSLAGSTPQPKGGGEGEVE